MNKNLNDFATNGIDGKFADNPVPDLLVGIEVGSAIKGFSMLIRLLPANDTVLVPLSIDGAMDWYAAFTDGLFRRVTFLRVEHGQIDKIAVSDVPSPTALANLAQILLPPSDEPDFDVEVVLEP